MRAFFDTRQLRHAPARELHNGRAQKQALDAIAAFGAELLVVSFGADTYAGDPISAFRIETPDYAILARHIAAAGLPTVIAMEGGYAVDALGANVASFLSGF